jgi:hypothetical protein
MSIRQVGILNISSVPNPRSDAWAKQRSPMSRAPVGALSLPRDGMKPALILTADGRAGSRMGQSRQQDKGAKDDFGR